MEPFDVSKTNLNSLSRESLIKWLQWNDPNGVYSDADSIDEGMEPLTKDEAIELIKSQSMGGTRSSNRNRNKPKNMKLKKGSKQAKDYMAKLRRMKGSSKVGATKKSSSLGGAKPKNYGNRSGVFYLNNTGSKWIVLENGIKPKVKILKDRHTPFNEDYIVVTPISYESFGNFASVNYTYKGKKYSSLNYEDANKISGYEGTTKRGGKTTVNYTNSAYKSPVKKTAKNTAKKTARKRVSGIGRSPDLISRKGGKTSVVYKMSGVKRHTDTKSHNVNIRVLSGVKHKKLNVVSGVPSYKDPDMAREIELYADNNSQLYFSRKVPILKNLQKKFQKGTYNLEKSAKLWRYYIDDAMQRYQKEFGTRGGKWHQLLTTHDRQLLALEYAENTLAEFEMGNFIVD